MGWWVWASEWRVVVDRNTAERWTEDQGGLGIALRGFAPFFRMYLVRGWAHARTLSFGACVSVHECTRPMQSPVHHPAPQGYSESICILTFMLGAYVTAIDFCPPTS